MSMRIVKSARRTDETEISLTLNLDGSGIYDVDTGCGFLNHMLELFSRHGRFDLHARLPRRRAGGLPSYRGGHRPSCWAARSARRWAIRAGINRYGHLHAAHGRGAHPCGCRHQRPRPAVGYGAARSRREKVGDFDTELVEEFLLALRAQPGAARCTCGRLAGKNSHHIIEGMFKALARALREAVRHRREVRRWRSHPPRGRSVNGRRI